MTRPYKPHAGSTARKVIDHLTKHGGEITRDQVAKKFGVEKPAHITSLLRNAIKHGLLKTARTGNGATVFTMPPPSGSEAPAKNAPLLIGVWSDGDVSVRGGTENEDGSVTYTRAQVQQLLAHVTQPHTGLAAVAPVEVYGPRPAGSPALLTSGS